MAEKEDIVIARVNEGKCPVCNYEIIEGDAIEFVDYNGTKQPVHKWHTPEGRQNEQS